MRAGYRRGCGPALGWPGRTPHRAATYPRPDSVRPAGPWTCRWLPSSRRPRSTYVSTASSAQRQAWSWASLLSIAGALHRRRRGHGASLLSIAGALHRRRRGHGASLLSIAGALHRRRRGHGASLLSIAGALHRRRRGHGASLLSIAGALHRRRRGHAAASLTSAACFAAYALAASRTHLPLSCASLR